tara:strand:+ start:14197 stop:15948 length:1752 start_codon:yes stop_codon:yes gene_type:complete
VNRTADLVLESATDYAIITTDLRGTVTFWSKGAERILGWSAEEALGQPADMIFTPEDRRAGTPQVEMTNALSKGRAMDQRWHLRRDGAKFWASGELLPLRDENAVAGFVKILRDRTGERLAEAQLRDSEARLALATDAAELGIWDLDVASDRMTYSPRAKAMFGFAPDHEPSVEEIRLTIHPDDRSLTAETSRRALDPAIKERVPYQYRIVLPTGDTRWILGHGEAIFENTPAGEHAARYIGTLQDVTNRVALEQDIRTSRARLALAIAAGKMAVWELDVRTNRVTSSPELNRLLGFPEHVAPTMEELRARYYPGEQERLGELGQAAMAQGDRFIEAEYRYLWPGQVVRWLLLRAEIIMGDDGTPIKVIGVLMDIQERKQAQELQSLLNQELSHRLKNQLAMVQGIVNQSLRKVTDIDSARASIVDRLTVLSQAHDLVVAGVGQRTDIRAIVQGAVRLHESATSSQFSIEGPRVQVGPRISLSLSLILHELATNAVKYGALSSITGLVQVRWTTRTEQDQETFELAWQESGGPTVVQPATAGFGSRLIRAGVASASSQVTIDYDPSGVRCSIVVPLEELTLEA